MQKTLLALAVMGYIWYLEREVTLLRRELDYQRSVR